MEGVSVEEASNISNVMFITKYLNSVKGNMSAVDFAKLFGNNIKYMTEYED